MFCEGQIFYIDFPYCGCEKLRGDMGKLSFGSVLDCLCLSSASNSCFCINSFENQDEEFEREPLVASEGGHLVRLKDVLAGPQTLAFQLKPKVSLLNSLFTPLGCVWIKNLMNDKLMNLTIQI